MKYTVRNNVFETNSSSIHVIAIGKEYDEKDVPDHIYFGLNEFGWEVDTYKDIASRASYLYTAICYNNSYIEAQDDYIQAKDDYIDYISETLGEQGITCEFEDPSEREFFCIDHVEDLRDWLKDLREDKSKLLMYLLSPDSEIRTGNDNGDSEPETDDLENNDNVELYWK